MFVEGAISQLNEDGTPSKDRYFFIFEVFV